MNSLGHLSWVPFLEGRRQLSLTGARDQAGFAPESS